MRDLSCGDTRVYLEIEIRRVHCRSCGAVKQEKLPWLANNLYDTKRFAFYVGRRCRSATIRDVARELLLHGVGHRAGSRVRRFCHGSTAFSFDDERRAVSAVGAARRRHGTRAAVNDRARCAPPFILSEV